MSPIGPHVQAAAIHHQISKQHKLASKTQTYKPKGGAHHVSNAKVNPASRKLLSLKNAWDGTSIKSGSAQSSAVNFRKGGPPRRSGRPVALGGQKDIDEASLLISAQEVGGFYVRPSVEGLPELTREENVFQSLVSSRDTEKVTSFIARYPHCDINCKDVRGTTALAIAVKNGDINMVTMLLALDHIEVGDCLLHAVNGGDVQMVRTVLEKYPRNPANVHVASRPVGDSTEYTADMTAVILAAHHGHYDVLRYLLKRGYTLQAPHPPNCICAESCAKHLREETNLTESISRYNAYKALANPVYIAQTSRDPILTAFELAEELKECAYVDNEFRAWYLELVEQCSSFALELLDQCRDSEEVQRILHRREGNPRVGDDKGWRFGRVGLAVDYDEKEFVAHSSSQQVMQSAWLDTWQDWRRLSFLRKVLRLTPRFIFLWVLCLLYIIFPKAAFMASWRTPINKYFSFLFSYIVFLVVLVIQNMLDSSKPFRGPPTTGLEWFIVLYIFGLTVRSLRVLIRIGPKWFFQSLWNWYDTVMYALFYITFAEWGYELYEARIYGDIAMSPRREWDQFDPVLIGEATYALAFVFAYGKLLYFLQVANALGPLMTSISDMFSDIATFLVLFIIILISFAVGLFKLYHSYRGEVTMISGKVVQQPENFLTIMRSFYTLYWTTFGSFSPDYTNIVLSPYVQNKRNQSTGNTTIGWKTTADIEVVDANATFVKYQNHHRLTQYLGQVMFAVYNVVGIMILINLLIAMMSNTFARVVDNADTEWKFARTKVWLCFFQSGNTVPPPFNLIPTIKEVARFFHKLKNKNCTCRECKKDYMWHDDDAYETLMGHLVQRYLAKRAGETQEKEEQGQTAVRSELDLLGQKIGNVQNMLATLMVRKAFDDDSDGAGGFGGKTHMGGKVDKDPMKFGVNTPVAQTQKRDLPSLEVFGPPPGYRDSLEPPKDRARSAQRDVPSPKLPQQPQPIIPSVAQGTGGRIPPRGLALNQPTKQKPRPDNAPTGGGPGQQLRTPPPPPQKQPATGRPGPNTPQAGIGTGKPNPTPAAAPRPKPGGMPAPGTPQAAPGPRTPQAASVPPPNKGQTARAKSPNFKKQSPK